MKMPPRIHTSVGEVLRLSIEALRGLGYSFSAADRLSRMIVWAEAVNGCAFRFMRMEESRIRAGQGGRLGLQERPFSGGSVTRLDGAGKSILDSGPRAFDLANAGALANGLGVTELLRTFGTDLVGELLSRSMERNVAALVLVRPDLDMGEAARFDRPAVWLAFPGGGLVAAMARPGEGGTADVGSPFGALVSLLVDNAAGADLVAAFEAASDHGKDFSRMLIVSVALGADHRESCLAAFAEASLAAGLDLFEDFEQRWELAHRCGFDVDKSDWDNLFALIGRTRIAASERSLHHAG